MARTRTWSTTIPVDHTQIKNLPDSTRDLREDLEERVDGILAGFVNTGATNGLLLGRLLTVGTNNALTPGTGIAGAYDIYCLTTGSTMELFGKDNAGNVIQLTSGGQIPAISLKSVYPVGCIYTTTVSTNPATIFGFGTWAAFGTGCVLVGLNANDADFDTVEKLGGAKTITLTTGQIPAHSHAFAVYSSSVDGAGQPQRCDNGGTQSNAGTAEVGGGQSHSNVQPYIVVYFWKRTA